MGPTFEYHSDKRAPTINDGYVTCSGTRTRELYIANGVSKTMATGLKLDIPRGVTVEVRGIPDHLRRGLTVVPEDLEGPLVVEDLTVYIRNQSDATHAFNTGDPIARVRAVETPKRLRFSQYEPPAEKTAPTKQNEAAEPGANVKEKGLM